MVAQTRRAMKNRALVTVAISASLICTEERRILKAWYETQRHREEGSEKTPIYRPEIKR